MRVNIDAISGMVLYFYTRQCIDINFSEDNELWKPLI